MRNTIPEKLQNQKRFFNQMFSQTLTSTSEILDKTSGKYPQFCVSGPESILSGVDSCTDITKRSP